jgi:hypothetical protein
VTQDPHTPEQAPGKPLNAPQGDEPPLGGIRGDSEGENSAQAGAQGLAIDGHADGCRDVPGIRGLLEHVGIDTSGRDITVAGQVVDPAPAHNAGPSVAECAEADRAYWERKDAGEDR